MEILKCLVPGQYGRVVTMRECWNSEDKEGHIAVYHAIRSNNVELLDTLLTTLSSSGCPGLLEQILSVSLEELLLKNVLLDEEMQLFVQSKLIKLRFYSKHNELPTTPDKDFIQQRLQLLQDNIATLTTEYSNKEVDSRFIYIAKFIVQNMHILKQALKSTYSAVPWEELEFCLVCFISAHTELKQINLFYLSVLRKDTLLKALADFSQGLRDLEGFIQSSDVTKLRSRVRLNRQKVVAGIIIKYPQFQDLYADHEVIRNIYSLDIMKNYINSALPADPETREGQLTIKRTLQVLGEHLKDTLDSPNLSTAVSDILLSMAPKPTRDILKDLRNSISHVHFIKDNDNTIEVSKLYSNILNDIKKVATALSDIDNVSKINVLNKLFSKCEIMKIEHFENILHNLNRFPKLSIHERNQKLNTKEHQNIGDIIEEISRLVPDKTLFEEETLTEIRKSITVKIKIKILCQEFIKNIESLRELYNIFQRTTSSSKKVEYLDFWRKVYLPAHITINPEEIFVEGLRTKNALKTFSDSFYESVSRRILPDIKKEIDYLLFKISILFAHETNCINWIDEYRTRLSSHTHHVKDFNLKVETQTNNILKDGVLDERITLHLRELGDILGTGRSHHSSRNLFSLVQKTKLNKLRIESLLLDTMSLLEERTSNNWLYLEDNMPLLSGRVLRNYLAHGNPLVDNILSRNSFSLVILNTVILVEPDTEEIFILNNLKMGKILMPNIRQLEMKYVRNLEIINKQEDMCKALVEGNLEGLQTCLREGADLYSRSIIDCSTTLHVAAKGTSVEMVKILIENKVSPDLRDINGQTPLHIAAAFGRDAIVQYFVEEMSTLIDQPDTTGKRALHVATLNGHLETVVRLLSLGANARITDDVGFSSLYYAIVNNLMELVNVLLEVDTVATVDLGSNLSPLHLAAEHGHKHLVQYLLENSADVNAMTFQGMRPLHFAATNGHQEIVINLIKHGAYVNLQTMSGVTPLHFAVLKNHEDVVNILLKEGAKVDIVCKKSRNTPLHTAITYGHKRIVQTLLKNKANINTVDIDGLTPLLSAARRGHCDIVELLLEAGAQLNYKNADGLSVLHISAFSGLSDIVTLLLKLRFIVDTRTAKQLTPLHLAAAGGHRETVAILLDAGADIHSVNDDGSTPLHMSAGEGHAAVSELLIIKGSNVNAKNKMYCTPLHLAVKKAYNEKTVQLLLEREANVEEVCSESNTALHVASFCGYGKVVKLLIERKADVNAVNMNGDSPLHLAVAGNRKAVVNLLLDNGAEINALNNKHHSALWFVVQNNNKEILDILLARGADINAGGGKTFFTAVSEGNKSLVEALLKCKNLNIHNNVYGLTFLHIAAISGNWHIGRALINRGVDIDSIGTGNVTALFLAVKGGHKEFVDVLLEKGADANLIPDGLCSPLHLAATLDHSGVVESLLRSGAKCNMVDNKNYTPIEVSIVCNKLNNLIIFLKYSVENINARINDKWCILEFAAKVGNLKCVQYLLDHGADPNSRDACGLKAIHIATYEGHQKLVELFLERGMSIGDLGMHNFTLLHLAALRGHPTLAQYLIDKHADMNAVNVTGKQPIHCAAGEGRKELVITLLSNGAMYNVKDYDGNTLLELTSDADTKELLMSVGQLFKAVNENAVSKVENLIKEIGKSVDAKDADNSSLLHLVSEKGFQEICDILLKNGANPNAVGKGGKTPLHFASEFSHLGIIVSLLQNGAVYNIESENGKTPFDLATQENTIYLLKLVEDSFKKAENCDVKVIEDITQIGDIGTIKAVLKSRNSQRSTLVEVAIKNNFPEVDKLYEILQDNFSLNLKRVKGLVKLKKFTEAWSILKELLNARECLLGGDDPGNLYIKEDMAVILYNCQSNVVSALSLFEEIYAKRRDTLGPNHRLSFRTRSWIALSLLGLGRNQEALEVTQEVINEQKKTLAEDDLDLLDNQAQLALCLNKLKKYDKALKMNYEVLEKLQKLGLTNERTSTVQTEIGYGLTKQGKLEEASTILRKVYEDSKSIYGINHIITLQSLFATADVLNKQGKIRKALEVYQEVYAIQKSVLSPNHLDSLFTSLSIMNISPKVEYLKRTKFTGRIEHPDFHSNHPNILALDAIFKHYEGSIPSGIHPDVGINSIQSTCEMDIIVAASEGDITLVESLIRSGSDVNTADTNGRTPLYFAASRGHADIIEILLKSGADATSASVKGKTALHTAALRGCLDSVRKLLQTLKTVKVRAYDDFINAKTFVDGSSALHVAAKKGFLDIVTCLLEHGVIHNSPDRSNGHTALQCSGSQAVTSVLELAQEMFDCAERGEIPQISADKQEYLPVVLASRDMQHRTPVQVARLHHHHSVVAFIESAQQGA